MKYPCIICSSFEHCAPEYPRKTKVQNTFQTKPTTTVVIVEKSSKSDNVPINVVIVVIACNQIPNEHVLRKCELVKTKMTTDWQTEE